MVRISNVCKSNLNSNFGTEVRKFEFRLTSLVIYSEFNWLSLVQFYMDIVDFRMQIVASELCLYFWFSQSSLNLYMWIGLILLPTDINDECKLFVSNC